MALYRDHQQAALLSTEISADEVPAAYGMLRGRRLARMIVGAFAFFSFPAFIGWACLTGPSIATANPFAGQVLLLIWPVFAATYLLIAALAPLFFQGRLGASDPLSERIQTQSGAKTAFFRDTVTRLGSASCTWLFAALALFIPLTLHLLIILGFGGRFREFSSYMPAAFVFAILGHVVSAVWTVRFCRKLTSGDLARSPLLEGVFTALRATAANVPSVLVAYAFTFGQGGGGHIAVFGIVLLVACAVVIVTGLAHLPFLYHVAAKMMAKERHVLENTEGPAATH
jgi:hypothetical protein